MQDNAFERVAFVLQESRLVPELTPREVLEQYAGYYAAPRDIDETVGLVGLEEKADVRMRVRGRLVTAV